MMRCREFVDLIIDYLEETLPKPQRLEFDRHMSGCSACVAYLKSYRETIRLERTLRRGPEDPPGPDLPEDLVQAILAARRKAERG